MNVYRHLSHLLLSAFCLSAALSCRKENVPDGTPTTLTVSIGTPSTKSTVSDDGSERLVNDLQVFVFDLGGDIDGYGHKTGASDVVVSTHVGPHEAWAVTNAPDLSSVTTRSALLSTFLTLNDQRVGDLVHIGGIECNVSVNKSISIPLEHLVSRMVVKKITNKLSPGVLSSETFRVTDLYLTNVAGNGNIGVTSSPSVWHNRMGLQDEVEFFLHDAVASSSQIIPLNASYSAEHRFYMMANPTVADSRESVWSPRHTRSLFRATIGADEYFYPITLPKGPNNVSYEANEIVVGRMGVKDEETELPFTAITYDVDVNDFSYESPSLVFKRLDTDLVFSEPGVNPLDLVSRDVDFSAPRTMLLFSDGSISPWEPQAMFADGSWSSSNLDLITFFGDAVSGYDAVSGAIEGKIGNVLAFTVGADIDAYDELGKILSSLVAEHVTLVFSPDAVLDVEALVLALQGKSVGYASFVFTEDGGLDFETLERLVEIYGDFIVSVVVDGEVVPMDEFENNISSGIVSGPSLEFTVSIAAWEEANVAVEFPVEE